MSVVLRFRTLVVLGMVVTLAALLPVSAARASHKKHFSQLYTCGTSDDADHLGSASDLEARVNLGHWKKPARPGHPCAGGRAGTSFVPSVTGVRFTFRWFAGAALIRTSTGTFETHPGGRYDDLLRDVTTTPGSCHWRLNGKSVTVQVTLKKTGYATRTVEFGCFPGVG